MILETPKEKRTGRCVCVKNSNFKNTIIKNGCTGLDQWSIWSNMLFHSGHFVALRREIPRFIKSFHCCFPATGIQSVTASEHGFSPSSLSLIYLGTRPPCIPSLHLVTVKSICFFLGWIYCPTLNNLVLYSLQKVREV